MERQIITRSVESRGRVVEVLRYAVAAGFFGLAGLSFVSFTGAPETITLTQAKLTPLGNGLVLSAQISNPSGPDRLVGIGSDAAARAVLIGGESFVLPQGSRALLAPDGAHGMLMGLHGAADLGRRVPVTLWFEKAGRVTAQARIAAAEDAPQTRIYRVPEGEPAPTVAISAQPLGTEGWTVSVETTNFAFSDTDDQAAHTPGVGHARLYLNGLKLQRMDGPTEKLGPLPPGAHTLRVTLGTQTGETYSVAGARVTASVQILAE